MASTATERLTPPEPGSPPAPATRVAVGTALRRGLGRRCPHCGRGSMYARRLQLHDHCPACGLRLLENQGDPWGFLIVVDRGVFIFPVVVALYLGLHTSSPWLFGALGAAVVAAFVATTPHRFGVCVAVDYLTRVRWGDLADPSAVPPAADGSRAGPARGRDEGGPVARPRHTGDRSRWTGQSGGAR